MSPLRPTRVTHLVVPAPKQVVRVKPPAQPTVVVTNHPGYYDPSRSVWVPGQRPKTMPPSPPPLSKPQPTIKLPAGIQPKPRPGLIVDKWRRPVNIHAAPKGTGKPPVPLGGPGPPGGPSG